MKRIFLIIIDLALLTVICAAGYYFIVKNKEIFAKDIQQELNKTLGININEKVREIKRQKPEAKEIQAIYITSNVASSKELLDNILKQVAGTKINALVIDIKDYSGQIAYDSNIKLVNELETDNNRIKNLPELLKNLHERGLYLIARQTIFQDPELSAKKPEWAVQNSVTKKIWKDYKGLSWADPSRQEIWQYNLEIAKEAISLGFDEVNFDYIRFPSDGPMSQMVFNNMQGRTKAQVMAAFFAFMYDNLKAEPAYLSADLFGFTTERDDDMNIGQQIEDAILYFDYVCPMVYPSHYPSGHLNLKNPAEHPYEVVGQAMKKGAESIAKVENKRGKIRPWLQAFDMGAKYTPTMIEKQIQASAENGGYGYLLWNARNVYNYLPK